MFYDIIELQELSGSECTIYSVIPKGNTASLYHDFVDENVAEHPVEISDLQDRLNTIGQNFGAREAYFTLFEGKPGDNVCALFDLPGKILRLYCIRFGMNVIILGGGGQKPKNIRTWQDDPFLSLRANQMIDIAKDIGNRLQKREDLWWSENLMYLQGDLKNYNDEEEH